MDTLSCWFCNKVAAINRPDFHCDQLSAKKQSQPNVQIGCLELPSEMVVIEVCKEQEVVFPEDRQWRTYVDYKGSETQVDEYVYLVEL